jgi:putative ABC transport system substrate-binding protein
VKTRRKLLFSGFTLAALVWTRAARTQANPPVVIGLISATTRESSITRLNALKEGLAALGWKEGANYVIEERWAQGQLARLPALAAELAAIKPAIVIAATSTPAAHVAKTAPDIPIVLASGDAIASGVVKSLSRPGGMITGLTNISSETNAKLVELTRDAVPALRRIGCLADASGRNYKESVTNTRRAAGLLRLDMEIADASRPDEIEPALQHLARKGIQALIVLPFPMFTGEAHRIVRFGLAQRWPVISSPSFADAGALATYGADRIAMYRRVAYFVDRILKGAKPGDLPVEQPTKYETVVNLKTAKALGITIPQSILVRADRVIE